MKQKISALLLSLTLLCGLLVGCGTQPSSSTPISETASVSQAEPEPTQAPAPEAASALDAPEISAEEPDVPEVPAEKPANSLPLADGDVTLTMFATTNSNVTDVIGDLNNHQIYQEAEKRTGVHIDIQAYTMENGATNFSLMMASGDLTDLIRYGANGYTNGLAGALEQEQIVDLTGYLSEYAPSYHYILEQDDQINLDVRTDNGEVLGFYQLYSQDGGYDISIARGPVMRKDLLDDLGREAPTTYEELTDILTAFKTEYDLSDPIWIGNSGFSDDSALIGGFDTTNTFYQVDGQVKYGPLDDGFRDYITMVNQWYTDGILNRDFVSYEDNPNSPTNEALKYSGQAGMHYCSGSNMDNYNNGSTSEDPNFNLVAVPFIGGADGINHFGQDTFAVKPMGCMTVTTGCKDVETAIKWCDFWYSDTGSQLSNYGLEGQTFVYDDNGDPHWTDFVTNNPDGVSYIVCRQVYLTLTQQPGIYNMDMELEQLSDNGKSAIEIWNRSADGAYLITSCYSMTAEESESLSAILSDINTLNNECWTKFITGDKPLSEFDAYLSQLRDMGIEEAVSIYQSALDRYYAR